MLSPIDSYYAKGYTRDGYLNRMKLFVDAFPEVDAWEVANEENGNWLGTGLGGQDCRCLRPMCAGKGRASAYGSKSVLANPYGHPQMVPV